ncbi:MAG TPA: Fur family transcriptional regulator [Marinobacterium sp.]|nr:Fur family transcriptional regulator [Marinobacterium sp.]
MLEANNAFNSAHNHQHCVSDALSSAKALCRSQGQRLTPIRELVLRLVWQSHKPLGAYELLPQLAQAGFNSAPPTVYRALDFLQELGLIHRISSMNAFIGCTQPNHPHPTAFMICRACRTAAELDTSELETLFHLSAAKQGFDIEQQSVELLGLCVQCRETR